MTSTTSIRHGFLRPADLWLHHVNFGGSGRPIVLLHGVMGTAWDWHDVGTGLTSLGRVVALDFRGHGDSQWSASAAYGSEHHLGDLAGQMDAMQFEQVDLVGYSWGALIAIGLAARQAHRIRRLVIIDVEPSFEQDEADTPPIPNEYPSVEDVVASQREFNPNAPEALLQIVAHCSTRPGPGGGVVPKHDPYFGHRWPFRSDDRWEELPSLRSPTLLVHAGASFIRGDVMQRMAETIPQADLIHLPDTHHVVPVDNPEGLLVHVSSFLA